MSIDPGGSENSLLDGVDEIPFESEECRHVSLAMILLMTCGMGGLQVIWSAIFSNGTLYLLALGLQDSWTTLVWAIPAICGCFLQPLVGAWSDISVHSWGRRRPYIAGGALGATVSILTLAWAGSLGRVTATLLFQDDSTHFSKVLTQVFAVFSILTLSLAIQPLQCGLRAILLDRCPAAQQVQAQSWATRLSGVGQIFGSAAGLSYVPGRDSLGEIITFRIIAVASILAVDVTVALTCIGVRETTAVSKQYQTSGSVSVFAVIRKLFKAFQNTPDGIRSVYAVQFVSWIGWFSFLFYNTSYLTHIYSANSTVSMDSKIDGYIASWVTLLFSFASFAASALIPTMVDFVIESRLLKQPMRLTKGSKTKSTECLLLSLWTIGLCLTAIFVLSISLTTNFKVVTALIAVNGVPWAVTNWVPFALIGHHLAEDHPRAGSTYEQAENGTDVSSGSISGLHNVAISAPQIFAAMVYGAVLWTSRAMASDFGINWVLRIGGIANLVAGYMAFRAAADRGWLNSETW